MAASPADRPVRILIMMIIACSFHAVLHDTQGRLLLPFPDVRKTKTMMNCVFQSYCRNEPARHDIGCHCCQEISSCRYAQQKTLEGTARSMFKTDMYHL
jgi:hypothetical protein